MKSVSDFLLEQEGQKPVLPEPGGSREIPESPALAREGSQVFRQMALWQTGSGGLSIWNYSMTLYFSLIGISIFSVVNSPWGVTAVSGAFRFV